ncbi:Demethylmenaquinone methyltransferase, partial [Leucoagaricus sp. SymC.cos]
IYDLNTQRRDMARLDNQHRMFLRLFDNRYIHVPLDFDKSGIAILESGAGTGLWLLELSTLIPSSTELIGIDIVDKLFPARETLPSNVTFQITSILDLPNEWANKFTFVHQRFLGAALRSPEWVTAINNMYRVLEPGGWVQLLEPTLSINSGAAGNVFKALLQRIRQINGNMTGMMPTTHEALKRLVEEAGFEDVSVTLYEPPVGKWAGDIGIQQRDILIQVMRGMKGLVLKNEGFGVVSGEEGYERFVDEWVREVDEGKLKPHSNFAMICARKPIGEKA